MTFYGATATMILQPVAARDGAYNALTAAQRQQLQQLWRGEVERTVPDLDGALQGLQNIGFEWNGGREDAMALLDWRVEQAFSPFGGAEPVSAVWLTMPNDAGWIDCGRNCHIGTKYLVISRDSGETHELVSVSADVELGGSSPWRGIVAVEYRITSY